MPIEKTECDENKIEHGNLVWGENWDLIFLVSQFIKA